MNDTNDQMPIEASGQNGLVGNVLGGVRQQIENQIGQSIDHYAGQVPGGERFTPEAKRAISNVLDGLQQQLENEASNRLGGLGGNLPSLPSSSGQQDNQNGML